MARPLLSIIIVSFNTRELLRECLQAVFSRVALDDVEVIVVDNASRDGSPEMVRQDFPAVRLLARQDNPGFGGGNNVGVAAASGDFIFLLNSDAILRTDTPHRLAHWLQHHPDVACVGPRIVLPSGEVQPQAFGHLPSPWRLLMQALGGATAGLPRLEGVDGRVRFGPEYTVGWLSGVCMCMRREHYLAVGGFDERFFMYGEDVALCGRLRRFGASVLLDESDVMHYGGASSPSAASRVRNAVWQQRHILLVCRDEFGLLAAAAGHGAVGLGLLLRLAAALVLVPRRGWAGNALLHTSWARLLDLVGLRRIPARPLPPPSSSTAPARESHAHRD